MEARPARWEVHPPLSPEQIRATLASLHTDLHLSSLLVQLLANRDLASPSEIVDFLDPPDCSDYPDPLLLAGMRAAVERISAAIDRREKIVVYGDFDADGVTSTALLCTALRHFGADVEQYIPNRVEEGYGLNAGAVRKIAAGGGKLLITVDCGISGIAEVAEAHSLGLDVVVTDHHHLPPDLPGAIACVNPKQRVDGCECYDDLAGVGVAYQLVRALVKRRGKPKSLRNKDLLAFVAIGTVADVVPLKGANRSLVRQGLAAVAEHSLPGLRIMLQYAHLDPQNLDTERIGFVIGPRLNAAGRLDDARISSELLMTEDPRLAADHAQKLEAHNRRRQALVENLVKQAKERARETDDSRKLILLGDREWPSGVIGLIAGKLVEEFGRPALVLEIGENESRGSARSIPAFDIVKALEEVADLLVRYGGHKAAAGFTVRTDLIPELDRRLHAIAASKLDDSHLQPLLVADAEIRMADVTEATFKGLSLLAPFGLGNPYPLFMSKNIPVSEAFSIGETAHLKLMLADEDDPSRPDIEAVAFRMGHMREEICHSGRVDLLYHIERREWKGDRHLQLRVRDMRVAQR